jgi:hypothetical protein
MRNRPVRPVSLALLALVGAASLALVSTGVALADAPPLQVQNCNNTPNREFDHQGQCVSAVETYVIRNGNTGAVGTCNLYFAGISETVPGGPYETQGACVSGLKALGF